METIVFDMGGVIIEWNPEKLSKAIDESHAQILQEYLFSTPTWQKLDAGLVSMDDGLKEVLNSAPSKYTDILTYAYYHWHDYLVIKEETESFIKELKDKGYRLYMLSNCSVAFFEYYSKHHVFSYFDDFYVSAKHRLMKPSEEIYLDFLKTYHLNAEDCLFIDDVLVNVEGARSVGMNAYHFKNDTSELRRMLL